MLLKLTFANGETHLFPFDSTSTLTATTRVQVGTDAYEEKTLTWTEITAVEIVEGQIADAPIAAPIEQAPETVTPPVATSTVTTEPPAQAPAAVEDTPVVEAPTEPAPETLATPAAALDHAETLPLPDAQAHITAALEKFPDDEDLVQAKKDIDELVAAQAPPAQS